MNQLIVFRGVQGLGNSGIFAMAFIVISDLFPPAERGRYQGFLGAVFGIASVIGPLFGGLLTDYGSGIIHGICRLAVGLLRKRSLRNRRAMVHFGQDAAAASEGCKRSTVQLALGALLILGVVPLILALELDKTLFPWGGAVTLSLLAFAAVALVVFVIHSRYDNNPILDLSLFKNRVFSLSAIASFFFGATFLGTIIFLPLFMVNVLGVSATNTGLSIIPLSIGLFIGSLTAGQLVARFGHYRLILIVGGFLLFAGVVLLSFLSVNTTYLQAVFMMLLCGIGMGPALPLYTLAIQNAVDVRRIGQATSASQFFRQIGSTAGIAILGTVLATGLSASFAKYMPADLASGHSDSTAAVESHLMSSDASITPAQAVRNSFNDSYALIVKVFKDNDKTALDALLANPYLPTQYKQQLAQGSPKEQVKKQFDSLYQSIAGAATTGDLAALQQIVASSPLPPAVQRALIGVVRSGNKPAIEGFLAQLKLQGAQQAEQIANQATDAALTAIKAQLDKQAAQIGAQVTQAIKQSFAESIARIYFWVIFVMIATILFTFFIPELPLRKSFSHPPAGEQGASPQQAAPSPAE